MLTALHIEGFEAIAQRQRADLAPLTLLVGDGGAGASVILHALLYFHELLQHGNADVDRTALGGSVIELGGFAGLVHGRDRTRTMTLRADFDVRGSLDQFRHTGPGFPFPDLDDQITSAWVELTIRMRTTAGFHGPIVDRVAIGAGSSLDPLVCLETGASLRDGEPLFARIDLQHPLLAHAAVEVAEAWATIAVPDSASWPPSATFEATRLTRERGPQVGTSSQLPVSRSMHRLRPVFALERSRQSAWPSLREPLCVLPFDRERNDPTIVHTVRTFLEMVVLGIGAQLAASLGGLLYVSALRTIPPRALLYEHAGRRSGWADGLAAWDQLLADRSTLVDRTNEWLRRLGTGCRVVVRPLLEALPEHRTENDAHALVRALRLDANNGALALPAEVGAGVSQLLPVIVAALESRSKVSLIELPELHVHPTIQVGLGDLFIQASTGDGEHRTMLVQTHSEHLILRLLRRIRQTSAGELPAESLPFSPEQLSVLHVDNHPRGLRIRRLRVNERGDLESRWPNGFFPERRAELL